MNTVSQKIALFLFSLLVGVFAFSMISSSVLASNVFEDNGELSLEDYKKIENESYNWFTAPLYGILASIEDPFGVSAEKIKPDAAKDGDLQTSFIGIINYLLLFLGLVLLVIIIYAGVLIIMSDGEEDAITKGRKMIMYALIGVIIIVLSYTIVNFIADVANGGEK